MESSETMSTSWVWQFSEEQRLSKRTCLLVHVLLLSPHTFFFHIILVLVSTSWLSDVILPLLLSGKTKKKKTAKERNRFGEICLSLYG